MRYRSELVPIDEINSPVYTTVSSETGSPHEQDNAEYENDLPHNPRNCHVESFLNLNIKHVANTNLHFIIRRGGVIDTLGSLASILQREGNHAIYSTVTVVHDVLVSGESNNLLVFIDIRLIPIIDEFPHHPHMKARNAMMNHERVTIGILIVICIY